MFDLISRLLRMKTARGDRVRTDSVADRSSGRPGGRDNLSGTFSKIAASVTARSRE
jgi:hypothetical protein